MIQKNKKRLVPVLLCFLAFSLGQRAKEEGKLIATAETGFESIYDIEILDVTKKTSFASEPVLRFRVPPSPKSYTLLFKWWTTLIYEWSDHEKRHAECNISLRPVSEIIPYNIDVWITANISQEYMTEDFFKSKTKKQRIEYFTEIIMRRDSIYKWVVNYKSGEKAPEWKAIRIFNLLINKGFDVEVWVEGMVQGMKSASYRNVAIEVLSLVN